MSNLLFPLGRAHRLLLGLSNDDAPAVVSLPERILLSPQVSACFDSHHLPGAYRSGPLYGHQEGKTMHIAFAAPAGYLRWQDYDPARPFTLDPGYVLGWTDALRATRPEPLEWVGTWLSCPDAQMPTSATQARLIGQARNEPWGKDALTLLFIGQTGAALGVQAHHLGAEQTTALKVEGLADQSRL